MIVIHISSYSKSLDSFFNQEQVCVVHSVFDNTINFQSKDRLIALTHQESALTPMSIQLNLTQSMFSKLNVRQHDLVHVSPSAVLISNVSYDKNQAQAIDLSYPLFNKGLQDKRLKQLKDSIEFLLVSDQTQGSLNNALLCLLSHQQGVDNTLEQMFLDKLTLLDSMVDESTFVAMVNSLIGFGEGLTPSGDDLLCGMLSVFHYLSHNSSIQQIKSQTINQVRLHASKTTMISREFLLYACDGLFNEHVSTLFKKHQSNESYGEDLHKISNLGHSSGTDFLVGMYFGLKIGGI